MKKHLLTGFTLLFTFTSMAQWQTTNGPQNSGKISSLTTKNSIVIAGTDSGGIYRSANSGISWDSSNSGLTNRSNVNSLVADAANIYAGVWDGLSGPAVFISHDDGLSWNASPLNFVFEFSLAIRPGVLIAGTWFGVAVSNDSGATWIGGSNGLPSNASVCGLAFSGTKIFSGVCSSGSGGLGVFSSTDGGINWSSFNNGFSVPPPINSLIVSGSTVFAGTTGEGIYTSADGIPNWSASNNGLTNLNVNCFLDVSTGIIAGTDGGVFFTQDNGVSWTDISLGLFTNTKINSITTDGIYIYVGTNTEVWKRLILEITSGISENKTILNGLKLFPTPTSEYLTIQFNDQHKPAGTATVDLINSIGEIILSVKLSGIENTLDIKTLPSGIYSCRISKGDAIAIRKIVIL